jgi:WD40 repeat protein
LPFATSRFARSAKKSNELFLETAKPSSLLEEYLMRLNGIISLTCLLNIVWLPSSIAQERATLKGHANVVAAVAFSPDGNTLATGSWDKSIRLWDLATLKPTAILHGHSDGIYQLAWTPDGKTLISLSHREMKWWDLAAKKERLSQSALLKFDTTAIAFAPGAAQVAIGSRDGTVRVWNTASLVCEATLSAFPAQAISLAFSPDAKILAAGSRQGQLRVWDLQTLRDHCRPVGHDGADLAALAFSPDGKTLASGSYDTTIKLWDLARGKEKVTLKGCKSLVLALAFSADGRLLASGERFGSVKLWDVELLKEFASFPGHTGGLGYSVLALRFSPNGKTLASASYDATVKLWAISPN